MWVVDGFPKINKTYNKVRNFAKLFNVLVAVIWILNLNISRN